MNFPNDYIGEILPGGCLQVMQTMPDNCIDTVITDPPYGLKFMGTEWDHGIPGEPFWAEVLRVAKPGAILLAFGGTRTHHRLMVAIEDAGWEIRDCMMWLYGSGFPKSLDISKAIDKAAGVDRTDMQWRDRYHDGGTRPTKGDEHMNGSIDFGCSANGNKVSLPATDDAEMWDGYGTGLKPAWEPIIVAMKPRDGTFAQNALQHGVAGFNIDGGRILTMDNLNGGEFSSKSDKRRATSFCIPQSRGEYVQPQGRWPANLVLSHTPECREAGTKKVKSSGAFPETHGQSLFVQPEERLNRINMCNPGGTETVAAWECSEDCPVRLLDEQSGLLTTGGSPVYSGTRLRQKDGVGRTKFLNFPSGQETWHDRSGGASRFFYCAKASTSERNAGLPEGRKNTHPTVKPLKLMEYLCKLTMTPTGGVVLDPFAGSGSTLLAAQNVDRPFIGIELDEEHCETARCRIHNARQDDLFNVTNIQPIGDEVVMKGAK